MCRLLYVGLLILLTYSCVNNSKSNDDKRFKKDHKISIDRYTGNYVSEMYNKREEGYDWVGVMVTEKSDSMLHISVRSRADKKRPTCTFDADCIAINDSSFKASVADRSILFVFQSDRVRISPKSESDNSVLYYYCSGGASLEGVYDKIEGVIDEEQVDNTIFDKVLELQDIRFFVTQKQEEQEKKLIIETIGLDKGNEIYSLVVDGNVVNAEVEDLNSDGSPELLIYTYNMDNEKGDVVGFSVNNRKSMSEIYLPPIVYDNKAANGYEGFDEFAVVETTLVRRFPIYKKGKRSGMYRQIQYKMIEGEATKSFNIDKIVEF